MHLIADGLGMVIVSGRDDGASNASDSLEGVGRVFYVGVYTVEDCKGGDVRLSRELSVSRYLAQTDIRENAGS